MFQKLQVTTVSLQSYIDSCKKLLRQPSFAPGWQQQKQSYQQRMRKFSDRRRSINQEEEKSLHTIPQADENQFIEANQPQINAQIKYSHLGVEFDDVVLEENDLVQFIIRNKYYLSEVYLTETQQAEFDEIFKNIDQLDSRNIGILVGMAMLSVIGCIALAFSVIGIVAFGVVGIFMGRYASKRIQRALKRKQNRLNELDIYEIRIRCLLKWVKVHSIKYKYNLNLLRFIVERIILEAKPALHYRQFCKSQQTQVKYILQKIMKLLKEPEIYNSLILSFRLCQEFWKHLVQINQVDGGSLITDQKLDLENALLRSVDNVLKPLNTLILFSQLKNSPINDLQKEIERFLIQPYIIQLSHLFPDPQMSLEFIKLFANKMKTPIKVENLEMKVRTQNFKDIENIGRQIGQEGQKSWCYSQRQTQQISLRDHCTTRQLEKLEKVEEIKEEDDKSSKNIDEQIPAQEFPLSHSSSQQQSQQQAHSSEGKEIHLNILPAGDILIASNHRANGSLKSEKIVLSITEHPNRVSMQYPIKSGGDQDQEAVQMSPLKMKQSNDFGQSELVLQQPFEQSEMREVELKQKSQDLEQAGSIKSIKPKYDTFTESRWMMFNQIMSEPYSSWQKVIDKDEILIYKTMKPGVGSVFVKGEALIRGVPKEYVYRCVTDPQVRTVWDKILKGFMVFEGENESEAYITFYTSAPLITTREFLQKRIRRYDFPKKGSITLLFYSAPHPLVPEKKDRIRVQTDIAAYIFEDTPEGTMMYFISNNDVKGAVPKFLVNYASGKAPFEWFGGLRKISLQLYKAQGDETKLKW